MSKYGEDAYTPEQLQQYRAEFQAEPRKILRSQAPSLWKRFMSELSSNPMTSQHVRGLKDAWRLYDGTDEIFYSSVRPGLAIGALPGFQAQGLSTFLDEKKRQKLSDYTDSYWDAIRTGWDLPSFLRGDKYNLNEKLAKLHEETPSFYWGEKFISEQFHPVNLIGWQTGSIKGAVGSRTLLGRMPFVGKIIEPFDVGYIQATNRVVDIVTYPVAWGVRKLPKTSAVKASIERTAMLTTAQAFFGNTYGTNVTARAQLADLMARPMEEVEAFGSPMDKQLRFFLEGLPPVVPTDLRDPARNRGILVELSKFVAPGDRSWLRERATDLRVIAAFNDILGNFAHGAINQDQVIDQLADALALDRREGDVIGVLKKFVSEKRGERLNFLEGVKRTTPAKATERIANRYSDHIRAQARYGIADANLKDGFIYALLDRLDPVYQKAWKGGVERYALRPSVEVVLNFGTYPVGTIAEESMNAIGGGVIPGQMSLAQRRSLLQGRKLPDPHLIEDVKKELS